MIPLRPPPQASEEEERGAAAASSRCRGRPLLFSSGFRVGNPDRHSRSQPQQHHHHNQRQSHGWGSNRPAAGWGGRRRLDLEGGGSQRGRHRHDGSNKAHSMHDEIRAALIGAASARCHLEAKGRQVDRSC